MVNKSITSEQVYSIVILVDASVGEAIRRLGFSSLSAEMLIEEGASIKSSVVEYVEILLRPFSTTFKPEEFFDDNGFKIDFASIRPPSAPANLDPSEVVLDSMLRDTDRIISGEERLNRHVEADNQCLTADHFFGFWTAQETIPEYWKETPDGHPIWVLFDATILVAPNGRRFVLSLHWDPKKCEWEKWKFWHDHSWDINGHSAIVRKR